MRIWPSRRGWKRIGIGLALLAALGLVINGVLAWRAEWQLQSRLAAIRAAGAPASIAELASEPVPDDQNAAAILAHVVPRLEQFSKDHSLIATGPDGQSFSDVDTGRASPTVQQIDRMRRVLNKYPDVDRAIAQAARSDRYASQADFSVGHQEFIDAMLGRVRSFRTVSRFVPWRMRVLTADSQRDEAAMRGIELLQLARLCENEPTMVSYLVANAVWEIGLVALYDVLAAGPITPETHAALDAELARHDDPQQLVRVLVSERAVSADWLYSQYGKVPPVLAYMFGWPLKSFQVGVLDAMEEQIELAGQPYQIREEYGTDESPATTTGHGTLADLLMPALNAAFRAHARSLAVARALRIYNALCEFAEKNGREATGLEELNLPLEVTIDPFSGQPLKLQHTDDGWVIYSVMENGVDDGGDFKGLRDYGVAPPKLRLTK